ncbi:MAG TPA: hypothetical protein VLM75_07540 [Spirochaetota bacterium]|nr:hypothetical protein [Spirochaetota bacterium]
MCSWYRWKLAEVLYGMTIDDTVWYWERIPYDRRKHLEVDEYPDYLPVSPDKDGKRVIRK